MNMNDSSKKTYHLKKRMQALFVAQSARPANLEEINLSQLTPFHRGLLVTDGTVTRFIEAYTLSSVEVVLLSQEKQILPIDDIWLEVPNGTMVVARQVILQTQPRHREKPTVHTYATSLIVYPRLPESVQQGLSIEGQGLGRLLERSRLETRRDLLWYGMERLTDLPKTIEHLEGRPFLSRTYRIIANGKPIMRITEKCPLY